MLHPLPSLANSLLLGQEEMIKTMEVLCSPLEIPLLRQKMSYRALTEEGCQSGLGS